MQLEADHRYGIEEIVSKLKSILQSGKIKNIVGKKGCVELIQNSLEKEAVFIAIGLGWGKSPFTVNCWKKVCGEK